MGDSPTSGQSRLERELAEARASLAVLEQRELELRGSLTNAARRVLAELFADAEDRGFGTWQPIFEANPDKVEEACAFIELRSRQLAEQSTAVPVDRTDVYPPRD